MRILSFLLRRRVLVQAVFAAVWIFLPVGGAASEPPTTLGECAKIKDDAERLKCYDEWARLQEVLAAPAKAAEPEEQPESKPQPQVTYLERVWELDREYRRGRFAVSAHRSNYFIPISYVSSPNEGPIREADPNQDLKNAEAAFQISIKTKLWQDIFGTNMDLWFAYTQRSFWQFYNTEDSSPFRETNYEPEMLLNFRTNYDLLGFKGRFINVGLNHQSNGRSEPLSRSWNRVVANFGFERSDLVLLLKTWWRIPESDEDDDNPHMEDYLGYGELWGYYFWRGHRFGIMWRNNLDFGDNRGAVQLEWSFPLFERVNGYIQYFNGYGESLLDYNSSINRIGIGFILKEWN